MDESRTDRTDVTPSAEGRTARTAPLKTAVLIPCFNEELTVAKVVRDFRDLVPGADVYVYDNNSNDATAAAARGAGARVVGECRQGKGFVVRSMFRDIDADVYLMVDGDDTYEAADVVALGRLVEKGEADMVVGDRLSATYFERNTRALHGFGNRLVRWVINGAFHSRISDMMTGARAFSRTFVKTFPVMSGGFEVETELTIHALDKDFVVRELPVTYRERPDGSVSKLRTVPDGIRVLKTVAALVKDFRPLQFFGVTSILMLVLSVGMFVIPLDEYVQTGYVSKMPTLIVAVTLGLGSLLSLACGVILDSIRKQSRMFYELMLNGLADAPALASAVRSGARRPPR